MAKEARIVGKYERSTLCDSSPDPSDVEDYQIICAEEALAQISEGEPHSDRIDAVLYQSLVLHATLLGNNTERREEAHNSQRSRR